jgi:hypothetical protein
MEGQHRSDPAMGIHGRIAASSLVSAISVGALRELLAQDLLAPLGEIRCAIEQFDKGKPGPAPRPVSIPAPGSSS